MLYEVITDQLLDFFLLFFEGISLPFLNGGEGGVKGSLVGLEGLRLLAHPDDGYGLDHVGASYNFV